MRINESLESLSTSCRHQMAAVERAAQSQTRADDKPSLTVAMAWDDRCIACSTTETHAPPNDDRLLKDYYALFGFLV